MAVSFFTPIAYMSFSALQSATVAAVPAGASGATVALVTNLGAAPASILLGNTNALSPSQANGTVVMPGHSIALAFPAGTGFIAGVALGFGSSSLNVAFGS
jgi:hypothetical protein